MSDNSVDVTWRDVFTAYFAKVGVYVVCGFVLLTGGVHQRFGSVPLTSVVGALSVTIIGGALAIITTVQFNRGYRNPHAGENFLRLKAVANLMCNASAFLTILDTAIVPALRGYYPADQLNELLEKLGHNIRIMDLYHGPLPESGLASQWGELRHRILPERSLYVTSEVEATPISQHLVIRFYSSKAKGGRAERPLSECRMPIDGDTAAELRTAGEQLVARFQDN